MYSFSIRNADGSDRDHLGFTDFPSDYAALAFGNAVIRDMLPGNPDRHVGCTMDVRRGERIVCNIAFP